MDFFFIYGRRKRTTNSSLVLSLIGESISFSLNLHSPCVLLWPQNARNETESILWNFWAHALKEVSASAFLFWKSAAKVVKRTALDYWIMRDHVERGSQRVRCPPSWIFQLQWSSLPNAAPEWPQLHHVEQKNHPADLSQPTEPWEIRNCCCKTLSWG